MHLANNLLINLMSGLTVNRKLLIINYPDVSKTGWCTIPSTILNLGVSTRSIYFRTFFTKTIRQHDEIWSVNLAHRSQVGSP